MINKDKLSLIESGLYYYKEVLKEEIIDDQQEVEYYAKLTANNQSSECLEDWSEYQKEALENIKENEEYIKQIDATLLKLKILFKW